MARRERADSGLRKGFIREDEAAILAREQQLKQELDQAQEEAPVQAEEMRTEQEAPATPSPAVDKKAAKTGATVSMKGVSGKEITGVVKVVKKKAKAKPASEKPAETPVPEQTKTVARTEPVKASSKADDQVEVSRPQVEQKPAAQAKIEPKAEVKPAVVEAKEEKAAPVQEAAKKVVETVQAEPAEKAETQAQTSPEQAKPALGSKQRPIVDQGITTSRYANRPTFRPQQGNYVGSQSDTPVGGRTGSGQYNRRPAGGRNFTGGGGYDRSGSHRPGQGRRDFSRRPNQPVFDKDADPVERQSRPRREKKRTSPEMAELRQAGKNEARKHGAQKFANNRDHNRREGHFRDRGYQSNDESYAAVASLRRSRQKEKQQNKPEGSRSVLTQVKLPAALTVKELAEALKKTTAEVITKLMAYGVMATVNQELDYDTAEIVANEFGIKAEQLIEVTAEDILFDESEDKEEDLVARPPVVVVMGHVDHGKTSILDYIRNASVAEGEAGGITQHIGAYTVEVKGKKITFLDTPGHEAFTTMRARGAQVTDIAILVVAADDGVMPQTIEAINHARAANTEIIVAINKIDKHGINLDRVRQELANQGLMSAEWGGDTTIIPVSAKTGENMEELLEMVTLTAEVMELKANPKRQAKGTVIEAKLDKGRGPVATVLVQRGTLRVGDTLVVGSIIGHIRAMTNAKGQQIESAGPSTPVEILGLPEVPEGGDIFYQVKDDKVARQLAEERKVEEREQALRQSQRMSLDNLFSQLEKGEVKDLNIIIKADVQGSVEAVKQSLEKLSNEEVQVQVIHGAVGAITESDVRLADVSNAVIIGFNVRPASNVTEIAKEAGVDIRLYRVIYEAIEDMEKALKGMLAPTLKEVVLGHAEVRETFHASGVGTIAGCYVTDGKINRSSQVRIVRDGIVIHEGKLASLRRFKDDVREVQSGYECGIGIERYNDIKIGDQFETFEIQEIQAE